MKAVYRCLVCVLSITSCPYFFPLLAFLLNITLLTDLIAFKNSILSLFIEESLVNFMFLIFKMLFYSFFVPSILLVVTISLVLISKAETFYAIYLLLEISVLKIAIQKPDVVTTVTDEITTSITVPCSDLTELLSSILSSIISSLTLPALLLSLLSTAISKVSAPDVNSGRRETYISQALSHLASPLSNLIPLIFTTTSSSLPSSSALIPS